MKERLQKLIEAEHLTPARLAEIIGVQRSAISHLLAGRNKPSFDLINRLLNKFPAISGNWLITGKGDMYRNIVQATIFGNNINRSEEKHSDIQISEQQADIPQNKGMIFANQRQDAQSFDSSNEQGFNDQGFEALNNNASTANIQTQNSKTHNLASTNQNNYKFTSNLQNSPKDYAIEQSDANLTNNHINKRKNPSKSEPRSETQSHQTNSLNFNIEHRTNNRVYNREQSNANLDSYTDSIDMDKVQPDNVNDFVKRQSAEHNPSVNVYNSNQVGSQASSQSEPTRIEKQSVDQNDSFLKNPHNDCMAHDYKVAYVAMSPEEANFRQNPHQGEQGSPFINQQSVIKNNSQYQSHNNSIPGNNYNPEQNTDVNSSNAHSQTNQFTNVNIANSASEYQPGAKITKSIKSIERVLVLYHDGSFDSYMQ